jgi:hypothetical protein
LLLLCRVGTGAAPLKRVHLTAELLFTGGWAMSQSMAAKCQVVGHLAERLGLGETVQRSLQEVFARWDGAACPRV